MKILLVYPEYPVTFWSFKHVLRFISKKAAYPPLGLLTVAGMLPRDWELKLVDLNVEGLVDGDIEWADYIMVSAMLIQEKSVLEVLDQCNRLGAKTIAGGPLFNARTEQYLDLVDHLILNEAEITLPPFLEDLAAGRARKKYETSEYPDLDLTPIPRWDLVNINHYATLMIQCSRGCPFNCEFCDITNLFGRRPRVKNADRLLAELQSIYDLGWRGLLFFVDDNFIGNKSKIKQILPALVDWMGDHGYPFTFLTEASINLADDDELIDLMVRAGFASVFIGLETPNEESLRECEKNQNSGRDMIAMVHKLQESGLQVLGGYILGFDSDDESIFARQIKFIQESGVVTAMVGLLNALPNTRLWQRLKSEGRLLEQTSGDNTDGTINFVPKMDVDNLMAGYQRVVKTIYSPRFLYQRICRFLDQYQPQRKRRPAWSEVKAFFKSIFYLGILGNGASQWYYWKLVVKSLARYRRSLPEAITLMVYGHHFRKVAKRVKG